MIFCGSDSGQCFAHGGVAYPYNVQYERYKFKSPGFEVFASPRYDRCMSENAQQVRVEKMVELAHATSNEIMQGRGRLHAGSGIKYSVKIWGRKTTVALEAEFWDALDHIVEAKNITRSKFIRDVARSSSSANLTSAVRLAILGHFRLRA